MTRVREFIEQHFFVLVALYVLGKVLMRVQLSPALAWDESEAALQAQYLLLGYGSQPPLYMWMQYAMFRVLGESVLAIALLKGLLILCVYYGAYAAARAIGADRAQAVWSSLALLLVPLFAFEAHRDLSHTVAATAFATLTVMFALRLAFAAQARTLDYAGLGLAIGLSLLSKYNLVPVVIALVVAALGARKTRARLLDRRTALAIGIAVLVVLPHYLWVISHWDLAFQGNFDKLDASGPWTFAALGAGLLEFCEGLAGFVILPALGVLAWLRPGWTAMIALPEGMQQGLAFMHRHLAAITLMLLALVVVTASNSFRDRWLLPLYVLLPLVLVC
ncbi:MAG: glycosyltransferase family 39 protein, partial [Gammaproteobacteria bacterium]|nr:glycosyltransferase family 39 protein [Gammaproteobacteria bacterium]